MRKRLRRFFLALGSEVRLQFVPDGVRYFLEVAPSQLVEQISVGPVCEPVLAGRRRRSSVEVDIGQVQPAAPERRD